MAQLPCPMCGNAESQVIDTRPTLSGLRRRRECAGCKERFTTLETVVMTQQIALAQEIEEKQERLNVLLLQADKVRATLVELKLKQAGQEKPKEPLLFKGEEPRQREPEPVEQAERLTHQAEESPPVIVHSLKEFNQLPLADKAEAIRQAMERAKQRVEQERNGVNQ